MIRFHMVVLLMGLTLLFLQSRSRAEELPPRKPLQSFPMQVGEWQGQELALGEDVLAVLGRGEFIQRFYQRPAGDPRIDFFVAFFPSQRTGDTIHSPKNCLPGAGWAPLESSTVQLKWPDGRTFPVNRYVIARGLDRQLVFYWYQSHGRAVASEYWAKYYLVADAIRMNRTDGALVRVVTPLGSNEGLESGERRALEFARQVLVPLDSYIPR
jgi:EpsI family protein